ncbi:hypothetical protein BC939DRAFT_500269 [Gamsiella multidivaricata]|uniref:uncharacterized protein n=1 Tax=Gamsiella multidivaricata TaxID=101098 RepID=UPI002220D00B|nr:uncharacterized protein BC939DRAFT_500269 [Gamsiella multidivaricata]KAI7829431.1 hypothetical protein BC939DRAFT_500269 [Gamsiella multidivaricata]
MSRQDQSQTHYPSKIALYRRYMGFTALKGSIAGPVFLARRYLAWTQYCSERSITSFMSSCSASTCRTSLCAKSSLSPSSAAQLSTSWSTSSSRISSVASS